MSVSNAFQRFMGKESSAGIVLIVVTLAALLMKNSFLSGLYPGTSGCLKNEINIRDVVPDVVTMNIAHDTHFTDTPDPRLPLVLRGWGDIGQAAQIDEELGDLRVRNVTSDLRGPFGEGGRKDGNSIFIFEAAGLCIGHLGHLHQVVSDAQHAAIGRLDVVMVPVDGGFTMDPYSMAKVVTRFRARLVLPMHWFSADGLVSFVKRMQPAFEVEIISGPEVEVSLETLPRRPTILVLEPALIP